MCPSTQRAKSRGPRPEASWLTLLFLLLFLWLCLSCPFTSVDTPHRARAGQGDILLWLAIYSPCFERATKQLPTPRHGSTSLPKCGPDPLGLLLFSPCALFFLPICLFFSLLLFNLWLAPRLATCLFSPPGFHCPALRSARGFLPSQANMPAGRGGAPPPQRERASDARILRQCAYTS